MPHQIAETFKIKCDLSPDDIQEVCFNQDFPIYYSDIFLYFSDY